MPEELKPLSEKLVIETDILRLQGSMIELCIARDMEEMEGRDEKAKEIQKQISRMKDTIEYYELILKEKYNVGI